MQNYRPVGKFDNCHLGAKSTVTLASRRQIAFRPIRLRRARGSLERLQPLVIVHAIEITRVHDLIIGADRAHIHRYAGVFLYGDGGQAGVSDLPPGRAGSQVISCNPLPSLPSNKVAASRPFASAT